MLAQSRTRRPATSTVWGAPSSRARRPRPSHRLVRAGSSGVPVGSHWTFEIYTHCGVEWIYLDGRFWLTEPLGKLNAPAGWGNPVDEGVVTLDASGAATYLSEGGDQVVFAPAPKSFEPPLCQ